MQKNILRLSIWLTLCMSFSVFGKTEQEYEDMYEQCTSNLYKSLGYGSSSVISTCSTEVGTVAQKEVNDLFTDVYQKIYDSNPEDATRFANSQIAWLDFKNSNCDLAGRYVGTPLYGYCPMKLTIQRVQQLQELNSGE